MKKSKKSSTLKRVDGVDKVGNLPDPVLHLILSGLPTTEEIIRTSVLSRRWRYLWTSIPRVDLDYCRGENPEDVYQGNKLKKHRFIEFVYWVLLIRTLNLDSVRLCCSYIYSMSTVGRWIHVAITRNVKQLHLVFRPRNESTNHYEKIEMPHCLVTCCSLEVLRLFLLRGSLSLPNSKGFPSLRVLEFNGVRLLDADIVKSFFKSCPLLEDLSLIDCLIDTLETLCISCLKLKNLKIDNGKMLEMGEFYACTDLKISCPKLVYLELSGTIAHNFYFDSQDSLKKAVIHPHVLEFDPEDDDIDDMVVTLCELFPKNFHVESLSISFSFVYLHEPEVDVHVTLPNVKTLEITMDCGGVEEVLQFLKRFPNMESLRLNIIWDSITPKNWKLKKAATKKIFSQQLKKVVLVEFYGNYHDLDRARFFLKHVKALEEIFFIWRDKAKFNEMSTETMNEISNFHKASSNVKLISLLKPYTDNTTSF